MCGIAGFAAAPGRPTLTEQRLRAMAAAIATAAGRRRLPRARPPALLAAARDHRRRRRRQPLTDQAGRAALMFNGEIWNYRELRRELEAAGCRGSASDAEVILHGTLTWDRGTLRRLRGMYAFADHIETGELHLARDPFGIKPMFLRETAAVRFGSGSRPSRWRAGAAPRSPRAWARRDAGCARASSMCAHRRCRPATSPPGATAG
jgi:asparagine synthase (glutamine-hydrolysing)